MTAKPSKMKLSKNIYRIIDANLNRASEGLRVIEDIVRFIYEDMALSKELKEIRHEVRERVEGLNFNLLKNRDADNDCGFDISQKEIFTSSQKNKKWLIVKNFKRVQEALRVIEENLKIKGGYELSKVYEKIRFQAYTMEKKIFSLKNKNILNTDIYCLTGEKFSLSRSNIEIVKQMIKASIKLIQYREKEKTMLFKYEECKQIRELTKNAGVCFIINDDIDLALAIGADGVHIGQEDMPIEEVRRLTGDDMIIGLSTHSPHQARMAVKRGADYIGVGPIFKTHTKKDVVDPVGYEYLEYINKNIDIPFVAIGGIKEDNVLEIVKRGAKCFAMVTEIVGADDIEKKIISIRNTIKKGRIR